MTNINNFNQIGEEELSNINGGSGTVTGFILGYLGGKVVDVIIEETKNNTGRDIVSPDNSHLQTKHTGRP